MARAVGSCSSMCKPAGMCSLDYSDVGGWLPLGVLEPGHACASMFKYPGAASTMSYCPGFQNSQVLLDAVLAGGQLGSD